MNQNNVENNTSRFRVIEGGKDKPSGNGKMSREKAPRTRLKLDNLPSGGVRGWFENKSNVNVSRTSVPSLVQGTEPRMRQEAEAVMKDNKLNQDATHEQVEKESLEGTKLLLLAELFMSLKENIVRVDGFDTKQIGNAVNMEQMKDGEVFLVPRSQKEFIIAKIKDFLSRFSTEGGGIQREQQSGVGNVDPLANNDLGFTLEHYLTEKETGKEIKIKLYFLFGDEEEVQDESGQEKDKEYEMAA